MSNLRRDLQRMFPEGVVAPDSRS